MYVVDSLTSTGVPRIVSLSIYNPRGSCPAIIVNEYSIIPTVLIGKVIEQTTCSSIVPKLKPVALVQIDIIFPY